MDTHSFHGDLVPLDGSKVKYNNCWSSGPLELYADISEDGKVIGFNDQVVHLLGKFLTRQALDCNIPVNVKPYLGEDTRDEETIASDRNELRRRFAYLTSRHEKWHSSEARVDPAEYITGRNEFFSSAVHLRRPRKWLDYYKLDKSKFTV